MAPNTGNANSVEPEGYRLPEEALAVLPQNILLMMQTDDFKGLGEVLSRLLDLPQSLCKQRGDCCKVVIFKGAASHEELTALANADLGRDSENARNFLDLFIPLSNQQVAKEENPAFVAQVDALNPDKASTTYYGCRYLGQDNRCQIHEDRPTGCRMYPIVHERSIFHSGCGYEETVKHNLGLIKVIEAFFQRRITELNTQASELNY